MTTLCPDIAPRVGEKLLVLVRLARPLDQETTFQLWRLAAAEQARKEKFQPALKTFAIYQRIAEGVDAGGIHVETNEWDAVVEYEFADAAAAWRLIRKSELSLSFVGSPGAVALVFLWAKPLTLLGQRIADGVSRFTLLTRSAPTRHEFSEYWKNVHGALVVSQVSVLEKLRHYVQNHILHEEKLGGGTAAYDGVVQTTYSSLRDTYQVLYAPGVAATIRDDEEKFVDRSKLVTFRALRYSII